MEALVLVDIQNDFLPGGALPVPDGDEVIPVANALMDHFDLVVATADWHPRGHVSFADSHPGHEPGETITVGGVEQYLWPPHCIQDTPGAAFPDALNMDGVDRVVRKGQHRELDSYSGFFDNARRGATELEDLLRGKGVSRVYLCGLATDVCVRATALDARDLEFQTIVVIDGCRGVDANPGDVRKAIDEMTKAGVQIVESKEVLERR